MIRKIRKYVLDLLIRVGIVDVTTLRVPGDFDTIIEAAKHVEKRGTSFRRRWNIVIVMRGSVGGRECEDIVITGKSIRLGK